MHDQASPSKYNHPDEELQKIELRNYSRNATKLFPRYSLLSETKFKQAFKKLNYELCQPGELFYSKPVPLH